MLLIAYAMGRRLVPTKRQLAIVFVDWVLFTMAVFVREGFQLLGKTYDKQDIATYDNFFNDHPSLQVFGTPYQYVTAPLPALNEVVEVTPTWGGKTVVQPSLSPVRSFRGSAHGLRADTLGLGAYTGKPNNWNTSANTHPGDGGFVAGRADPAARRRAARSALGSQPGSTVHSVSSQLTLRWRPALHIRPLQNSLIRPRLVGSPLITCAALLLARTVQRQHSQRHGILSPS